MGNFGRKGLEPGDARPAMRSGFGRAGAPQPYDGLEDHELAAIRAAFIESERQRLSRPATLKASPEACGGARLGVSAPPAAAYGPRSRPKRSMVLAYLLWFVCGQISAHRFYLGSTQSALMQLGLFIFSLIMIFVFLPIGAFALAVWGLWLLADAFLIPGLHRDYLRKQEDLAPVFA